VSGLLPGLVDALGSALLHFVWKGAMLGMATAVVLRLLRHGRPQVRYAVLLGALLLCVAIPALDTYRYIEGGTGPSVAPDAFAPMELPIVSVHGFIPWLVTAWLLGVAAMAVRLASGLLWVGRAASGHQGWGDAEWQSCVSGMAEYWGIRRHITLRIVPRLRGPLTAGWWRPVVLVPAALLIQMPPPLLEALLAHEVAHIRRLDYLFNLLQVAVEALLFFHPVVWWLSRGVRIEREKIADEIAASYIGEPRRLALALEQLSGLDLGPARTPSVAQSAGRGSLSERIGNLVHPGRRSSSWRAIVPAAALAMAVAGLVLVTPRPEPDSSAAASAPNVADAFTPNEAIRALRDSIRSNHALLIDDSSGNVLLQKNASAVAPIASLTKLVTAMVVLDAKPDREAVVSIGALGADAASRQRTGVPVGTSLPFKEVLRLALMSSDNRATYALASRYPGGMAAFEHALRAKTAALGLAHTTLSEPTGLSALNTSTAADMAVVAGAAARYPDIAQGTTTAAETVDIGGRKVEYRNTNSLVGQQGWDIELSKTGFIDAAGRCMVMRLRSSGRSFTMVLLDSGGAAALSEDIADIRNALQGIAMRHRA
jgi:D-alanyl-D-alanine endopeptidase (penicillin-binding protein 7)